jgi:hypothetical protein
MKRSLCRRKCPALIGIQSTPENPKFPNDFSKKEVDLEQIHR